MLSGRSPVSENRTPKSVEGAWDDPPECKRRSPRTRPFRERPVPTFRRVSPHPSRSHQSGRGRQKATVVPLLHYVKNLVRKTPVSVIEHSQLKFEFQRRHRVLALCQKIDRQKPGGERKLRSREDRSGHERSLMVAGMALVPPDRQHAKAVMVAGRTAKP